MTFRRKGRFCRPFLGDAFYKPRGVPMHLLEMIKLEMDELEAMRHCDFEDMDQETAAKKMKISRGTIQRLLYSGRKKVLDALLHKKALNITTHEDIQVVPHRPRQGFGPGCGGRGMGRGRKWRRDW